MTLYCLPATRGVLSIFAGALFLCCCISLPLTISAGVLDYFTGGGQAAGDGLKRESGEELQIPSEARVHRRLDPSAAVPEEEEEGEYSSHSSPSSSYGVDVSFPIHHSKVSDNFSWLPHNSNPESSTVPERYNGMVVQPLGDKNKFYNDFMKGCHEMYKGREMMCDSTETDRISMNLRQPKSMQNYTSTGFKKIRAPDSVFRLIKEFWETNHETKSAERWSTGNTYTNHWDTPTYMVSVEDTRLRGGGANLKKKIWDAARDVIQEWTGEELTECSLYGIRIYEEGAVLASHVDRLPLVSSAIINVAQDVDEPWPIEVYGHDGRATNVTMEPGEMVLYESHSVVHGRPFPLKGRFYANLFIHFEPVGHSLRHNAAEEVEEEHVDVKYRKAAENGVGGHETQHGGLPPYIMDGSAEADHWRREHREDWRPPEETTFETGSTEAHIAAQRGDLKALHKIASDAKEKRNLLKEDRNGWTPLHEGARGGHLGAVELLVEHGADVNKRTNQGAGGTALWLAKQSHGKNHPVTAFLEQMGALEIGPEL